MITVSLPVPDLTLAETLFDQLFQLSFDGKGITREAYGPGEQRAHALIQTIAIGLGFEVVTDHAMNLYVILPGQDRTAPKIVTGSHLDSVPSGGNFDGTAGVLAGLAVLSGWKKSGTVPPCDLCLIAIRAEESAWFPISYLGSKTVLGKLTREDLLIKRRDNQISIADHIRQCGGDPDKIVEQPPLFAAENMRAFIELHIEQGPVLENENITVGIVSGICGSLRYRFASTRGQYAHSGACPAGWRQDAVVATAELVTEMQRKWYEMMDAGHELTVTFGRFSTDAVEADMSKVSGHVEFCIDFRSRHQHSLLEIDRHLQKTIAALSIKHGVTFALGEQTSSPPAALDKKLGQYLQQAASELNISFRALPSGAGHDCAQFATCGVPAAMLFIRNQNGSHNPQEAMELTDFNLATEVLNKALFDYAIRDSARQTPRAECQDEYK